jgi:uncharacterized membrane protein
MKKGLLITIILIVILVLLIVFIFPKADDVGDGNRELIVDDEVDSEEQLAKEGYLELDSDEDVFNAIDESLELIG